MPNKTVKKKKCPDCLLTDSVIKYGRRKNKLKYFCKNCSRFFTKDYSLDQLSAQAALNMYLDGSPLRKIGHRYNISPMTVYRKCRDILTQLPQNEDITQQYCDMRKFSGVMVIDGKYIAVKGYSRKIPLVWGIDYATHDIPHFMLVPSEDYSAALEYFRKLRKMGYRLHYLVCDDNPAFKMAARHVYPDVAVQMCLNHYKESIRRKLGIKVSAKYRPFFFDVEQLFNNRLDTDEFGMAVAELHKKYDDDVRCRYWLEDLRYRNKELTNYRMFKSVPNTTNLVEVYNSHLQARLKGIKRFESYEWAHTWLNGYVLNRRLKPFTDCGNKFMHLNGRCSLEQSMKAGLTLPTLFGNDPSRGSR